jgi:general secretion pathway protein G
MKNNKMKSSLRKYQAGFTLLEIMIVVIIIGIIAGFAIVNLVGTTEDAKIKLARSMVKGSLATQVSIYQLHNNSYPPNIEALVTRPSDAPNWRGPYLNEIPKDPWGEIYQYRAPGAHNTSSFDLYSKGPDKTDGTADDIGNWSETSN